MKKNNLKNYSFLAAAFLSASSQADAQIYYTDIDPDGILDDATEFYKIDLNHDGQNDIALRKGTITGSFEIYTSGNYYSVYLRYLRLRALPINNNSVIGESGTYGYIFPSALDVSDPIDAKQEWFDEESQMMNFNVYVQIASKSTFSFAYTYLSIGNWNPGDEDKFLGIKVIDEKDVYYGWIRMDITEGNSNIIIKDYAINSNSGIGINAGEVDPPVNISNVLDETTVEIFAFEKIIYLNLNYTIVQTGILSIYNSTGTLIYENELKENATINCTEFPRGIYTIQYVTNQGIIKKQLSL